MRSGLSGYGPPTTRKNHLYSLVVAPHGQLLSKVYTPCQSRHAPNYGGVVWGGFLQHRGTVPSLFCAFTLLVTRPPSPWRALLPTLFMSGVTVQPYRLLRRPRAKTLPEACPSPRFLTLRTRRQTSFPIFFVTGQRRRSCGQDVVALAVAIYIFVKFWLKRGAACVGATFLYWCCEGGMCGSGLAIT